MSTRRFWAATLSVCLLTTFAVAALAWPLKIRLVADDGTYQDFQLVPTTAPAVQLPPVSVPPGPTTQDVTPAVEAVQLYDATTNKPLRALGPVDVLDLVKNPAISLVAQVSGRTQSVRFTINSKTEVVENHAPFDIAGDTDNKVNAWAITPGKVTVDVQAFAGPDARGESSPVFTIDLTVTKQVVASAEPLQPFLGVNLDAVTDYGRSRPFTNVIKWSRKWGTVAGGGFDGKAPVNEDGWPTTDAGTMILTDFPAAAVKGVYSLSWKGKAVVSVSGPAQVMSQSYDAQRDEGTAALNVTGGGPCIFFKGTDGGVRDVQLLCPGYQVSNAPLFTNDLTIALTPFKVIRFMDWLKTNNSMVGKWDGPDEYNADGSVKVLHRAKLTDAQWTLRGVPYETCIDLGNTTHKNIWVNIPTQADDDFVRQLGALIRNRLDLDLVCYVEYSNEVWNGVFTQFNQNLNAAKSEVQAAGSAGCPLNDFGKNTNQFYWAWDRVAERSVQIKKLLGDDPRIRVVLASQVAQPSMLQRQLEWVQKYQGAPKDYFYAVAGASYFYVGKDSVLGTDALKNYLPGAGSYDQKSLTAQVAQNPSIKVSVTRTARINPPITKDEILGWLSSEAKNAGAGSNVLQYHQLALQYGLRSFAYEMGVDLGQFDTAIDQKIASQVDPRMGPILEQYLQSFYYSGGDGLCYFALSSSYSKFGYWGLTQDVADLTTSKYRAASDVATMLLSRPAATRPTAFVGMN